VWRREPSLREVVVLWVVSFVFFVGFIAALRNYFNLVDNFSDGGAYMSLASATRHWDFRSIVIKPFWGLPYAMTALSRLTGASDRAHCCSSASCLPWWAPQSHIDCGVDGSQGFSQF